jgi:hypothetical protein
MGVQLLLAAGLMWVILQDLESVTVGDFQSDLKKKSEGTQGHHESGR